jgi:hypothetical protein
MARDNLRVKFSGPFFEKDPVKTLAQNMKDLMDDLTAGAEEDVKAQMVVTQGIRRPVSSGVTPARVAAHVVGRTESLTFKEWRKTGVVSVQTRGLGRRQAIALMAAASEVEAQTGAFRRTAGRIRRARADLTKGLN